MCDVEDHRWSGYARVRCGWDDPFEDLLWVVFDNDDKAGAFVKVSNIVRFNASDLDRYKCDEASKFFGRQKRAFENAIGAGLEIQSLLVRQPID